MASPIAFAPKNTCLSVPLCAASQFKGNKATGSGNMKRIREAYCSGCLDAPPCTFVGCDQPSAPLITGSGATNYCANHYRDPAVSTSRSWKLCSNSKLGCRQLAQARRSGKCFVCEAGNLPCLHASLGCPQHVRGDLAKPPRKRQACSDRAHNRCRYDPDHPTVCKTPRCGNLCLSPSDEACSECTAGRLPCNNACSRRAHLDHNGYRSVCSALNVLSLLNILHLSALRLQ